MLENAADALKAHDLGMTGIQDMPGVDLLPGSDRLCGGAHHEAVPQEAVPDHSEK